MFRQTAFIGLLLLVLSCSENKPMAQDAFDAEAGPWQTVEINGALYRRVSAKPTATGQGDLLITIPIRWEATADGTIRLSDTVEIAGRTYTADCASQEIASIEDTTDDVENDPGYVDAWVGEYEGTGDFALSNGVSGEDRPVSISIVRVTPKKVTVTAELIYGEGRNDFFQEIDILQPNDPEQITLEVRYLNAKTVYDLTKEEDTITGSITTSSLRLGGTWGQDQIMTDIEVVRQ